MKKLLAITLIILALPATAQRIIYVAPNAIFPFDPISTRYAPHSLAPVHTYIAAWRAEGQQIELAIALDSLSWGYKYYVQNVDTTLMTRMAEYLSASIVDTLSKNPLSTIYDFPISRNLLTHFEPDIQAIRRFFATPLTTFDSALVYNPYAPCQFTALLHNFQLSASKASISIFTPPSPSASLPPQIYVSSIARLFPFDNNLVITPLTGHKILQMLENSLAQAYSTMRSQHDNIINPNSRPLSIAGATYVVDITKPRGHRIVKSSLDLDSTYIVALNSYAARNIPAAPSVTPIGNYKTLLINFFRTNPKPQNCEQWCIIPQRWLQIQQKNHLQIPLL